MLPIFLIDYSLKRQNTLWLAKKKYNEHIIILNKNLLEEYTKEYIQEVFIYEYVHLVIFKMFLTWYNWYKRVMPHWKEFKAILNRGDDKYK